MTGWVSAAVAIVVAVQVAFLGLVMAKLVELVSVLPVAAVAATAVGVSVVDSTSAVVVAMGSLIGEEEVVEED